MAELVYVLCTLTSAVCAALLLRAWWTTRIRLLLWCLLCFTGLALNNLLLFVDKIVAPHTDLSTWRTLPATVGVALLVYGLIWNRAE